MIYLQGTHEFFFSFYARHIYLCKSLFELFHAEKWLNVTVGNPSYKLYFIIAWVCTFVTLSLTPVIEVFNSVLRWPPELVSR